MNTEQLKQAAMAATPGPWFAFKLYSEPEVRTASDVFVASTPTYLVDEARYIAAANPATILALLECVDALRLYKNWCDAEKDHGGTSFWDRVEMCREAESATDAALQKLEAL